MISHAARAALLAAGLACAAWAQTSSIQGVIKDSSGSVVPGAAIQTTNIARESSTALQRTRLGSISYRR